MAHGLKQQEEPEDIDEILPLNNYSNAELPTPTSITSPRLPGEAFLPSEEDEVRISLDER